MSITKKIHIPQPKNFFWVQTRRLAKSFEPLNRSLPLLAPELCSRKAMCNPFFWREILKHYRTQKSYPPYNHTQWRQHPFCQHKVQLFKTHLSSLTAGSNAISLVYSQEEYFMMDALSHSPQLPVLHSLQCFEGLLHCFNWPVPISIGCFCHRRWQTIA